MQYLLSTKIVVVIYHCQGLPGYHTLETINIGLVGIFVSQTIEILQWTCVVKSCEETCNSTILLYSILFSPVIIPKSFKRELSFPARAVLSLDSSCRVVMVIITYSMLHC